MGPTVLVSETMPYVTPDPSEWQVKPNFGPENTPGLIFTPEAVAEFAEKWHDAMHTPNVIVEDTPKIEPTLLQGMNGKPIEILPGALIQIEMADQLWHCQSCQQKSNFHIRIGLGDPFCPNCLAHTKPADSYDPALQPSAQETKTNWQAILGDDGHQIAKSEPNVKLPPKIAFASHGEILGYECPKCYHKIGIGYDCPECKTKIDWG